MTCRSFALFAACTSLALAIPAGAQSSAPSTQPAVQPADPTLKGPTVADRPGTVKTTTAAGFGPDSIEKKKAGGKKGPPPPSMADFMKTLDVLNASTTPQAAHLTPEQNTKIQSIASAFEADTKSYLDKNKTEIDSLRAKLSPTDRAMLDNQLARGGPIHLSKAGFGGKKGSLKQKDAQKSQPTDPNAAAPSQPSADEAAARTSLVEIYAGRPKVEDAEAKILGTLNPDQLTLVDAQLAQLQTQGHGAGKHKHAGQTAPKVN